MLPEDTMEMERRKRLEDGLKTVPIEKGEITEIDFVPESFPSDISGIRVQKLPGHCRIRVHLWPSPESDIRVELYLPLDIWNGNFLGTGNGGWAGSIPLTSVYMGVNRGFAAANTNMGSDVDPDALIGKTERWVDFGHRATHLMTVVSKQLIRAFYGRREKHSYFVGGSTGGQQALMEAQRYPDDYDGIVAFCPAYNRIRLHAFLTWTWKALASDPDLHFSKTEIDAIAKKVIDLYGEKSGSAPGDNFLSYPGKIERDIEGLAETFRSMGLQPKQVEALKMVYQEVVDPVTGEKFFASMPFGCENSLLYVSTFRDWFAKLAFVPFLWLRGKDFDITRFDFHRDMAEAIEKMSPIMDATDPDLSSFKKNGGKLLLISGSMDCLIPYSDTQEYYERVVKRQHGLANTLSFFRYFHIPGLGHGTGGAGFQEIGAMCGIPGIPLDSEHDALSAMVEWVENRRAPERLLPVAFVDGDMTKPMSHDRPVFPYPYETEYVSGDPKDKANFRRILSDGGY